MELRLPLEMSPGREAMVMAPPSMCDPAVSPCFHGCAAFFHRHFSPQSPPSHPLSLSLCSQQQPSPRDCSTIPKLQLSAVPPSRGLCIPIWGMYGCGKDCLSLILFRLPKISCLTLSLKCFSSDSDFYRVAKTHAGSGTRWRRGFVTQEGPHAL